MSLLPPTKIGSRSQWADWLEISCIVSNFGVAKSADLKKAIDLQSDDDDHGVETDPVNGEPLEKEILEGSTGEILEKVHEELVYRKKLCGDAYPFELIYPEGGASFDGSFKIESKLGEITLNNRYIFYVLGLMETALRDNAIAVKDVSVSNHRLGMLFQIASCLAVGGYLNGPTVWFGFPRPEKNAFLPALRAAMDRFGSHKVVAKTPPGYPAALKDGGIDIIAWLDFGDGRAAKTVILGQVASGYDWEGKTLNGFIPKFLNWFVPPAPAHIKPAILIPFPIHHHIEEDDNEAWEDQARGWLLYNSSDFGVIFDRFRVARFAAKAIDLPEERKEVIDGWESIGNLTSWLSELIVELKEKKAA